MAGEDTAAVAGGTIGVPLQLIHDVVRISRPGFSGRFKKDCTDLARRVSLLAYLLEEIGDSKKTHKNHGTSSLNSCFSDLAMALQASKRLLFAANNLEDSSVCIYNTALYGIFFFISS